MLNKFLDENISFMCSTPDRFTSSDVYLGGCCQGVIARNHGVFPRIGGEGMRGHVFGDLSLRFGGKQT